MARAGHTMIDDAAPPGSPARAGDANSENVAPPPPARAGAKALIRPAIAIIGVVMAVVLVWASFREVGLAAVMAALARVNPGLLLAATAVYGAALLARGLRWHMLLARAGTLTRRTAIEGLLVGFATNFALPGRLGELYRADYMNALAKISRSTVLGTIFVERAFDGLILAGLLALASASLSLGPGGGTIPLNFIVTAVVLFAGASAAALMLRRLDKLPIPVVGALFERFKSGLLTADRTNFVAFLGFTVLIWTLEAGALAVLLNALGQTATLVGVTLLLSASSLSTLLPTAPAFIGSYQFAYVLCFGALGWATATALAASILVQLAFFVPTMALGFALALRAYGRAMVARRQPGAPADG